MNYEKFVEVKRNIATLEKKVRDNKKYLNTIINELKSEGKNSGRFALDISGHGFKQIYEKLEVMASDYDSIFRIVYNPDNPSEALIASTNLKVFIFTMLAKAEKEHKWKSKKSQNNKNGIEYVYTVEVERWKQGNRKCLFTAIVENNNIKTGYFDWSV